MMDYLAKWLVIINLIGLSFMWNDKQRAKKRRRRIPERSLFAAAWLGGSLGTLLGMYLFHHKTKHFSFVLGIPIILMVQATAICLILYRL